MIYGFAALLCCQLAGETAVRALAAPIPGPVVGMALLAALLLARMPLRVGLTDAADGLLKHLSLLFVPAGVGVVQHLDRIGGAGLRLLAVIVLSTALTLAVTALVFAGVARLVGQDAKPSKPRADE